MQFVVHNTNGASGLDFVANVTANGQSVGGVGTGATLASGVTPVMVSGSGITDTPAATTCTSIPGGWAQPPVAGSQWISSHSDCTVPVDTADFTYTATFTLPAGLSGLALNGAVLADDTTTVSLNGHPLSTTGNSSITSTTFSTTDATFFNPGGSNTLAFVVHNAGGPSGLDFVATVTATGQPVGSVSPEQSDGGAHGACVSSVARSHTTTGRNHGAAVSAAAHSCPH